MGKIVKYCTVCEEGFAEKFSFCPNCASALTAFEMNPVGAAEQAKITEPIDAVEPVNEPVNNFVAETPSPVTTTGAESSEKEIEPETPKFLMEDDTDVLELDADDQSDEAFEAPETAAFEPLPATTVGSFDQPYQVSAATENDYTHTYDYAVDQAPSNSWEPANDQPVKMKNYDDGEYHIAIVEEKNNTVRNGLLLAAFMFVMLGTFVGVIISIFTNDLNVGAINEDSVIAYLPSEEMIEVDTPEAPKVKKEDKAGGGGGGGKEEPTPATKGELARQVQNPEIAPSSHMDRLTNPTLTQVVATTGPEKDVRPKGKYGIPTSNLEGESDGTGRGGGIGGGDGRGQGNGRGGGAGNGNGTGIGNGNGNSYGDGNGDGDTSGGPPPAKKEIPAVTTAMKIISKPKALYTDAARQNQVQGTVRLRVTFMANGSIGSISPINGLGNGLTEQAISAARAIRFEPQKVNGQPVAVTKTIEYSFTLY